jgi:hypothetical protein
LDQDTHVIGAVQSISRNSVASPLVSKSQIAQLPLEHPAEKYVIGIVINNLGDEK